MKKLLATLMRIFAAVDILVLAAYLYFGITGQLITEGGFRVTGIDVLAELLLFTLFAVTLAAVLLFLAGKLAPKQKKPPRMKKKTIPKQAEAAPSEYVPPKAETPKVDIEDEFVTKLLDCARDARDEELLKTLSDIGRLAKGIFARKNEPRHSRASWKS